jgi:hypothetical protein
MTVAELDQRMSRREMTNWIAYYRWESRERERAAKQAQKQAQKG